MSRLLPRASLAILLASASISCTVPAPQSAGGSFGELESAGASTSAIEPAVVSLEDIVLLTQNDISDQTILIFLTNRQRGFTLDAQNRLTLREAGTSEEVIQKLWGQESSPEVNSPTPSADGDLGYTAQSYPGYYYNSGYVGGYNYPLGWYNYHYSNFNHSAIYYSSPRHSYGHVGGHGSGHSLDRSKVHRNTAPHTLSSSAGHRANNQHGIQHQSFSPNHSTPRHISHLGTSTSGTTGGHSSRHSPSSTSGHSLSSSSGHAGGRSGSHGGSHSSSH